MLSNKINTKIQLILLIIIVISSILLLQESFSTHDRANKINLYSKQLYINNSISEDITNLIATGQKCILYSDKQYLDDFRNYSTKIIKNELELYNLVTPANKQVVENIIELSKAYISFVENEVLPTTYSGKKVDPNDIKYLQLRHNEFNQELRQKVDKISAANMSELNNYFQVTFTSMKSKITLLVVFLLSALTLLLWGMYTAITSLSVQHLYLNKLSEHIKSAIILTDRKGYFKELNKSAENLFDISSEKILDMNINEIPVLFPQLQHVTQPLYAVILQKKALLNHSVTYYHSGQKLELTMDYIPIIISKRLTGVMMVATVVEEYKDKHILLDTLEAERKRISIEIHDWIARYLSTIIHSIDYIFRLKNVPKDELQDNLLTLRNHCQNAAIEMRGIMNNIHPYLIDKVGLVSALESYINIFEKLNNIKVYVFYQSRSLSIPNKSEIIIYRIIQEALSNIAKHSTATEVDIHFTVLHHTLKIELEDNGENCGEFVTGKGMWGMKERAKLIGGNIIFEHKDSGFCVTLTVPIILGGQQDEENQRNAD